MIRRFIAAVAVLMLAVATGCQDNDMRTGSQRDLSNPSPASMEGAASERSSFVGSKAPAFTLLDQNGDPVKLSDFQGQWLVLYFYPADDTPGCICEATEFTNLLVNFENMNARVVGMNNETPSSHRRFIDKYNLEIDLLSDPTQDVLRQYGAWIDPPGRAGRVVRGTFLIGPRGIIRHHWPEVIPTGHAQRVQEKLRELRSQ